METGPNITLELTHQEAEELKQLASGTVIEDRITTAQTEAVAAAKRREEAKRTSRQRTNQNRKARIAEMREKAAAFDRLNGGQS